MNDFEIDANNIKRQWINQPSLVYQYSKAAEDAREKLTTTKNKLEVMKAEKELEIRRSDPSRYGLEKFTESVISTLIQTDEDVIKYGSKIVKLQHDHGVAQAACRALDHKKSALQDVVRLNLMERFGTPTLDNALDEIAMKDNQKSALTKKRK